MSEPTNETADTFTGTLRLIALIENAPTFKARIMELQRQTDALAAAQAKHAGELAAMERRSAELDARSAALDERERKLRRREAELRAAEEMARQSAAIRAGKTHDYRGDDSIAGSGLSRELS